MVDRVIIDANNFKVSKPGVNADGATFKDLLLDSSGGKPLSVYQTGTFFSSGTPAYDSNFQPIPQRITFPALGYIPLIMWQMRYYGRSVGGGYWWPITADDQYYGAQTPTTEQANYQGGYIIMADGFFDFGNNSGVDATVRYVIFHTQV